MSSHHQKPKANKAVHPTLTRVMPDAGSAGICDTVGTVPVTADVGQKEFEKLTGLRNLTYFRT